MNLKIFFIILAFHTILQSQVIPERSILITDLEVLNHSDTHRKSALSFGGFWKNFSRSIHKNPKKLAQNLIQVWSTTQKDQSEKLLGAKTQKLLKIWSDFHPDRAPFRLLSIGIRPDLQGKDYFAGEGRLIFGLTDGVQGRPLPLTMIYEFKLPSKNQKERLQWWKKWKALSLIEDAQIRILETEKIVLSFANAQNLLQVRVNDFVFHSEWVFREFKWDFANNTWKISRLKNTPSDSYFKDKNQSSFLEKMILNNQNEILKGQWELPKKLWSLQSTVPTETFSWLSDSSILTPRISKSFSKITCNGCHGGATQTRFQHVFNRKINKRPMISEFLKQEIKLRKFILENSENPFFNKKTILRNLDH